jgi:hypothetical protein
VVKVGQRLFEELGARASRVEKLEWQVGMYRETLVALGRSVGVEVPSFVNTDGGSLGAERDDELRQWLDMVLSKSAKVRGDTSRSRGRGRGVKGTRSRSTREKGKSADRMDEGD